MDSFDATESERQKDEGMELAAANRSTLLKLARELAVEIARSGDGTCHVDQVGQLMIERYGIESLGPATGSLFKTPEWEWTGTWHKSTRVTNHSRRVMLWRLKS